MVSASSSPTLHHTRLYMGPKGIVSRDEYCTYCPTWGWGSYLGSPEVGALYLWGFHIRSAIHTI